MITYQATEQFLAGDLARAEATAQALLDFGSESGFDSFGLYAPLLAAIRSEQGRLVELVPLIEQAAAEQPHQRGHVAALARALARAGRFDDAVDVLQGLAIHNYDMPHNENWFIGTDQLADAVEILGDTAVAAVLRERLTPFAGRIVDFASGVSRPPIRHSPNWHSCWATWTEPRRPARAIAASRTRKTPIFLGRELVLLATARRRASARSARSWRSSKKRSRSPT